MLASEELPSTDDIRFYLRLNGWTQQTPGPAGALWTKEDATIAVPDANDPRMSYSAIVQLAELTRRQQPAVASEVKFYGTDVTEFGAANDTLDLKSIPLASALTIITNIKQVLRA